MRSYLPLLAYACALWHLVGLAAWGFGWMGWAMDLPNHLVWWMVLAGVGGVAAALGGRQRVIAAVLAGSVGVHAVRWRASFTVPAPDAEVHTRVVVANALASNAQRQPLVDMLVQADADVVGVLEVTKAWQRALQVLQTQYPYRLEHPRPDAFGLSLYSRHPMDASIAYLGPSEIPSIDAKIGGTRYLLVHPPPPVDVRMGREHRVQLAEVAQRLRGNRTVVLGDLNSTPLSARFPATMQGWPAGTWPSGLAGWLRLPIDHVLTSRDLTVVQRKVLRDVGSDHRPVLAELADAAR